jgi:hypothetical protein
MASLKDVEQVADDLERLVNDFRNEVKNRADFERLIELADEISEHADNAASTFTTMNEALMGRINELEGGKKSSGSSSASREKSEAAA